MKPSETPTTTPQFLLAMAQTLEIELNRYETDGVMILQRIAKLVGEIEGELSHVDYRESAPQLLEIATKNQGGIDLWNLLTIKSEAGQEIPDKELKLSMSELRKLVEDLKRVAQELQEKGTGETADLLEQRRAVLRKRLFGVSDQENGSSQ